MEAAGGGPPGLPVSSVPGSRSPSVARQEGGRQDGQEGGRQGQTRHQTRELTWDQARTCSAGSAEITMKEQGEQPDYHFLRRSSCREQSITLSKKDEEGHNSSKFSRSDSLLALSSANQEEVKGVRHRRTVSLKEKVLGRRGSGSTLQTQEKSPGEGSPHPPRPDRGIFLNLENLKEALFGDSWGSLSPIKSSIGLEQGGKHVQTAGDKTRGKVTLKDEFTEFSQYGSRFVLNQPDKEQQKDTGNMKEKDQKKVDPVHCPSVKKRIKNRSCSKPPLPVKSASCAPSISPPNENLVINNGGRTECGEVVHRPPIPPSPPSTHSKALNLRGKKLDMSTRQVKSHEQVKTVKCQGQETTRPCQGLPQLRGFSAKSDSDSGIEGDRGIEGDSNHWVEIKIKQVDLRREYDVIQLIGEGWFSRVYLAEHRTTRDEVVLKAINSNLVSAEEFVREFQSSAQLWPHKNILKVYDAVFQCDGYYMFATEYAPLGDLTSNIATDLQGIGEVHTKRVGQQVGSALEWIHSKNLCHLDVKLDNILVFKSDFSLVKLCDFGSVRSTRDIVIKKNELMPYCPAELVAKHANEYYQVDRVQDVFQFGIVVFFCLLGVLPWQKADLTDPHFAEFAAWRRKRSSKLPRNFKPMTSRAQKLFRKLLDPDPAKRLVLAELTKYLEDKWLRKVIPSPGVMGRDGQSQLTLGSFQSVHSNLAEKNAMLYTLLQHGVETTVDRSHKNKRIINWIKQGAERNAENDIEEEPVNIAYEEIDDLDDIDSIDLNDITEMVEHL